MTGLICYKHATVFCFDAFVQGLFTGAQDVPSSPFAVLTTPTASLLLTGGSEPVSFPESEAENLCGSEPCAANHRRTNRLKRVRRRGTCLL